MNSFIQKIKEQNRAKEKAEANDIQLEINNPKTETSRRNFLKKSLLGGMTIGGLVSLSIEDTIAQTTSGVNRTSSPSDLKITDLL